MNDQNPGGAVERFDCDGSIMDLMFDAPDGMYVLHSDYAALQAENKAWRTENATKLKEIERLLAENERLRSDNAAQSSIIDQLERSTRELDCERLTAENERLRAKGEAMAEEIRAVLWKENPAYMKLEGALRDWEFPRVNQKTCSRTIEKVVARFADARNELSDVMNTYAGVGIEDEKLYDKLDAVLEELDGALEWTIWLTRSFL